MSLYDTFRAYLMKLASIIHRSLNSDIIPLELLSSILKNKTLNARKALIKRACQKGELIRVKNELYVLGDEERKYGINNFTIANLMVVPSYVSLESALSYYNLIPETVYTTTSVTINLTHEYQSPLGQFSFSHLKENYFNQGFYQAKLATNSFLIATPLKALIDTLVVHNKKYEKVDEIIDDLRFDWDEFKNLKEFVTPAKVLELKTIYRSSRMLKILTSIEKNL